jgi:lysophospholipase L1-like esterase
MADAILSILVRIFNFVALGISIYHQIRKQVFSKIFWASAVGVSCFTFPFTQAPEVGFGWVSMVLYGLLLAFGPLCWTYLVRDSNYTPVDWRSPALLGGVLSMGWFILETMARTLPGSPHTYLELNQKANYQPALFIDDSTFLNPFYRQQRVQNTLVKSQLPEFEQTLRFNNWGFNDTDWPQQTNQDTTLWLAMGDSFTEGIGSNRDSTWPKLLERKLSPTTSTKPIRVFNAGFSGADPLQNYRLLDSLSLAYKFHVVIWALNDGDLTDIMDRGELHNRLNPPYYQFYEYYFGLSFLFRRIWLYGLRFDFQGRSPQEQLERKEWAKARLRQLRTSLDSLAQARGFMVHVVVHPTVDEFREQQAQYCQPSPMAYTIALPGWTQLVNCYCKTEPQTPTHSLYWPIDRHHTPKGYQLMAECIYESLPDSLKQPIEPRSPK